MMAILYIPLAISNDSNANLGLYSLSGRTSYPKISWSLEAARCGFRLFQSLWNCAAAEMPDKFQSDTIIITRTFAASRLHGILQ